MKTRAYRVALAVLGAAGAIGILLQNAGDLTDPTAITGFIVAVGTVMITAWRQIGDPTTPTIPPKTP